MVLSEQCGIVRAVWYCQSSVVLSEQCGIAASETLNIRKKLILPLYKAIVRPHLEYCSMAWRPYRKKDIDTLECIQRRATKMIPEQRDLSYEERLKECGLTTLETRRVIKRSD